LLKIKELLTEDGEAFISTPCWNGTATTNHISEMKYEAFGSMLEGVGFSIIEH
jgi:hypothetical protein